MITEAAAEGSAHRLTTTNLTLNPYRPARFAVKYNMNIKIKKGKLTLGAQTIHINIFKCKKKILMC